MNLFFSKSKRKRRKKSERVFFIVNPVSGKMKVRSLFFDIIEALCGGTDSAPSVALTEYKGHAESLALHASNEGFDRIICCGGDGTLNETVNGVLKSKKNPKIGYIPSGTTNDFANCLGISTDVREAAVNAINGKDVLMDTGSFCTDSFFTYIASFGMFTTSSYATPQQNKNVLGHLAYVIEGLKDLGQIKTTHARVTVGEEAFEGDYIFGAVTNTLRIGGVVKLDKSLVNLSDGIFEVVLVKAPGSINDFNKILNGIANTNFENDMFTFRKAESVTVELPAKTPWSVDGELRETPEDGIVRITVSKHSITLTV